MGPATPPASRDMVVDHADSLDEGVDDSGTDKAEPRLFMSFEMLSLSGVEAGIS